MPSNFVPAARIDFNGRDVTTAWGSVLVSLTINDEAGIKADTSEFIFDNSEGFSAPPIGAEIQIWLGYEPRPVYMGRYIVDSWTKRGSPSTLWISGKSADFTADLKETRLKSWHETTVGAIVRAIAGKHGLGAEVDGAIGARQIEHIDQNSESDVAFLSRLAKRNGATFKLGDGKLIFAAKGSKLKPSGEAKPSVTIRPADVTSWSATHSERSGHKSVKCAYIDRSVGKRIYVTAGNGSPVHLDKRLYGSQAEAQAAAEATLADLTRGKASAQIEGAGNTALCAEALVTLAGFDPDVDGGYLATSVTHCLDAGGYTTRASLIGGLAGEEA